MSETPLPTDQTVPARDLRVGDRIPVTRGAFRVRISSVDGLEWSEFDVATVTCTEYRPLDFQYVTTDHHDGPLVFLTYERVTILAR